MDDKLTFKHLVWTATISITISVWLSSVYFSSEITYDDLDNESVKELVSQEIHNSMEINDINSKISNLEYEISIVDDSAQDALSGVDHILDELND